LKKKDKRKKSENIIPDSISSFKEISSDFILKNKYLIPLIGFFLLLIIFTIRQVSNYDIGFHLAGARFILETFSFPSKDVFTYTVNSNEYIDIQWLFQIFNFFSFSVFGYNGLIILNTLLLIVVFLLLVKRFVIYKIPSPVIILSLFIILISIQIRISIRPEIFTWIGILLTLIILDNYYLSKKNKLFFLPIVMMVWVNSHGLFIIGLFLIVAYIISIWYRDKLLDKNLSKWFVISIAAIFINPYFADGAFFPIYLFTRLDSANIFKNSIAELQSPLYLFSNFKFDILIYFIILGLAYLLFFITLKKRYLHEFLILSAFTYISLNGYRNIPILIFYAVFIIAISLNNLFTEKNFYKIFDNNLFFKKYLTYTFCIVFLLTGFRVVTGSYYSGYGNSVVFGTGLNENTLPVSASNFIKTNLPNEKIINQIDMGGWLIWSLNEKIFIDGRLEVMKEEFYSEYMNSFKANGLKLLIDKYNPKVITFNHASAYLWTDELNKMGNWSPLYFDNNFSVYTNQPKDSAIFVKTFYELVTYNKIDTTVVNRQFEILSDIQSKSNLIKWIEGFYKPFENNSALVNAGNFFLQNRYAGEAEIFYLNYLLHLKSGYEEIYIKDALSNLGELYLKNNLLKLSLKCYEVLVKFSPDDLTLRNKIINIRSALNK